MSRQLVVWFAATLSADHFSFGQETDAIDDSCSLLQTKKGLLPVQRVEESSDTDVGLLNKMAMVKTSVSSQCLKFLHIPKNGGSSMDSLNMHQPSPVFDSLMYRTYQRIAASMPPSKFESRYASNVGNMYDASHKTYIGYTFEWMPRYTNFYHYVAQPDANTCEDLHTPPSDDAGVAKFYKEGDCSVFCAVRAPLDKFISGYEMSGPIGPCDPVGFEAKVRSLLAELRKEPSLFGCVFVPQVQYVFGAKKKSSATGQYCNEILRTEHLNADFDSLMKKHGHNVTLPPKSKGLMGTKSYPGCLVDKTQVTQAAKDLIYEHFRADYEAFGYPHP